MLEQIIDKKKKIIDEESKRDKEKIDFIKSIFDENSEIMQNHMKEHNLSLEEAYNELHEILYNLKTNLHIEAKKGQFKLKEINECLQVKLGYYKIFGENIDLEKECEQSTLTPTEKGRQVEKQYRNFY